MHRKDQSPKQKILVLALAAAITSMVSLSAAADCSSGTISSNTGSVTWSTGGNCTVNSGVTVGSAATANGLSVSATAGTLTNNGTIEGTNGGLFNLGTIGLLTNAGTIRVSGSGGNQGLENDNGTIDTLSNSGTISGYTGGLNNTGTIGLLTNTGTIRSTNSLNGVGITNNGGTIGTLNNSGTISGYSAGIALDNGARIGNLTNASGGVIQSNAGTGVANNDGTIGTLTNNGLIQGAMTSNVNNSATGIFNVGSIGILTNSGTIIAFQGAIDNEGMIGTLNNSGTISSTGNDQAGIELAGIYNSGGSIGSIINSGLISGFSYAIVNASIGTLGTITNSGTIAGEILNNASRDLVIDGGAGSTFGTLTGYASGSIGSIVNTLSNVDFGSGNILLNDEINVGSNAVNNMGTATLQVNHTVTITGNYNQSADASLLIGVANSAVATGSSATDSGYGRLAVTGSATIASGSSVGLTALNSYGFAAGQRFVVVQASSTGTNYNQGSLDYSISGYTADLTGANVTDGSDSDLVVTVVSATKDGTTTTTSTPTPSSATVPNAITSLGGLANYTGVSPALLNLFDAADALAATGSAAALNKAGTQLSPIQQSASAAATPTLNVLNVIAAHADSLRLAQADGDSSNSSGISTGEAAPEWGVWGQAFGGHASQDERDGVPGYNANYGGLLLGVDKAINSNWRAGGVFSYSNTSVNDTDDAEGDNTQVNGYGLIGYATYTGSPWYVNLSGGVVQQEYSTNRLVDFTGFSGDASGHFSGQQYVARAEGGYPIAVGAATFTPLASLTYTNLHQGSYTEGGGNGAALSIGSTHTASVKSGLGFKLEQSFATSQGNFVPDFQLQWIHEYDHTQQVTGASYAADTTGETAFTTVGATPVADLADASVGLTLLRSNNLSLTLRYELQAGGGFVSQTGSLRLRQAF